MALVVEPSTGPLTILLVLSKLESLSPRLTTSTNAVNLDHFKLLRVVGKGAFGKVRIVERKDTGLTFALKYIRKDEGPLRFSQASIMHRRRLTL